MNELVKQLLDFARSGTAEGFAMFLIVMAAMYYAANTIVGIVKWIAIAIQGHPASTKCESCEEEIED
jgi:hypothetical protein